MPSVPHAARGKVTGMQKKKKKKNPQEVSAGFRLQCARIATLSVDGGLFSGTRNLRLYAEDINFKMKVTM
jgi:hypothetical protein